MSELFDSPFGSTRTHVAHDHAVIGPDSHVRAPLPHWDDAEVVVLISPALGAAPRGPRFCQYLVYATDRTRSTAAPAGVERLIYVLDGRISLEGQTLSTDGFAWLPPGSEHAVGCPDAALLLVFEKPYVAIDGHAVSEPVVGTLAAAPREPFLGDSAAMLATLLPVDPAFDMAVNVFTFEPGATLPFVETHVMEHGLYVRSGTGVYRLGENWYPVGQGDTIWMAAYCPQWFVATGKQPARYIYYKDIHRHPLQP
jgi:(S)-ureidoglycine aminohydrolase